MYVVSFIDIDDIDASVDSHAYSLLTPYEKGRYSNFMNTTDAKLFMFGRYIARLMISELLLLRPEEVEITVKDWTKKPYVAGHHVEFSISHSGRYVAVAVSYEKIGVDVQTHDQADLSIFESFFTDEEVLYVRRFDSSFYSLWTAMESLAKITGYGLNEALENRTLRVDKDRIMSYGFQGSAYYAHELKCTDDYTLTVMTESPTPFRSIHTGEIDGYSSLRSAMPQLVFYCSYGNTESEV